jgi:mannose-6-phosphate isomerase-like protein (cupin superfamily)
MTHNFESTYLRLKPDMTGELLPGGAAFWSSLMTGKLGNFHLEHLVTVNGYVKPWPAWEMHPHGDEVICLIEGAIDLRLEKDDHRSEVQLRKAGDFLLVKQGTWHTANPQPSARMLFITAGEGTVNRPVKP